jgi:transcriptional regulator with XRE-family HTH domain
MTTAPTRRRSVPPQVLQLRLADRIKWARKSAGLSHDRLVERLGRSNRGHLIKIEKGVHVPGHDLRDAIADECGVPRELFDDDGDEESDPVEALMNALRRVVREELHS